MILTADLHIHVGFTNCGQWIKIPSSKNLTLENVLKQAQPKGLNLLGIIDALSPAVQKDLEALMAEGKVKPLASGGYIYDSSHPTYLFLGAEIETVEQNGGMAHTLIFLPDLITMKKFTKEMSRYIRNVTMSSQNAHMSLAKLIDIAQAFEAVIIPAHVFTPYKSLFGVVTDKMSYILSDSGMAKISAVEIGLSGDSDLADTLAELTEYTLLTSSDAHSLDKMGREFTVFDLEECNFSNWHKALLRQGQQKVIQNVGLNPKLGKYHATFCQECGNTEGFTVALLSCPACGSRKIVKGVFDRIHEIATWDEPHHPDFRPPYLYQIPLEFIPGLGKKSREKLLAAFNNEIYILHKASLEELAQAVGLKLAERIVSVRQGPQSIQTGGGGIYGKVRLS